MPSKTSTQDIVFTIFLTCLVVKTTSLIYLQIFALCNVLKVIKIFLVMCEVVGCSDVVDDGFCHHDNNGKWFGKPTRKCEQSRNSRMERLVFAGPNVFRDGGRLLARRIRQAPADATCTRRPVRCLRAPKLTHDADRKSNADATAASQRSSYGQGGVHL